MKKISLSLLLISLVLLVAAGAAFAEYEPGSFVHENENFGYFNVEGGRILPENANLSGVYGVLDFAGYDRSVPGQNVHTNFQKNTNSCASCHMTHTAASSALLFRDSVANTCAACHDGSLGRLNVFTPSIQMVQGAARNNSLVQGTEDEQFPLGQAVSGTFGVADFITVNNVEISLNPSTHNVSGGMTMRSAPGGNMHGQRWNGTNDIGADWAASLTCASCHEPHGSHSMRLLKTNVNNIGNRTAEYGGLKVENHRLRYIGIEGDYHKLQVLDLNGNQVVPGPWLWGTSAGGTSTAVLINNESPPAGWIINRIAGHILVPLAELNATNDVETITRKNWTYSRGNYTSSDVQVNVVKGFTATVARGIRVLEPDIEAGRIVYSADSRREYDYFCAACHTDYNRDLTGRSLFGKDQDYLAEKGYTEWVLPGSGRAELTGIYSKAHRHTVRSANSFEISSATCVSCHFVHGADALIMKTADEYVIGAAAQDVKNNSYKGTHELLRFDENWVPQYKTYTDDDAGYAAYIQDNRDVNPSSALKRYTNMASCWKCHSGREASFTENPYWLEMNEDMAKKWRGTYNPNGIK